MLPVYIGTCPDEGCNAVIFFPSKDKVMECRGCGQRHSGRNVKHLKPMHDHSLGVKTVLRCIIMATSGCLKKTAENVKVNGLSHFHCKLLSPLLNNYGMDKVTNRAKLLSELTNMSSFDCGVLGDRCFLIDHHHLNVVGYGRDNSGSARYLSDTLQNIREANENKEVLVPLHSDADGHCLVHAISRALTGRELFWFPLRSHLKRHLIENLDLYKRTFRDFINVTEWDLIIDECDPHYVPEDERYETIGLRNMHVFGLANVLKRPIILLDSLVGMHCFADYSAVFLPALVNPQDCRSKTGVLNPPLCLAWSSSARNHFIPLVGIKGEKLPVIPRALLPNVWGVEENLDKYVEFDSDGCVAIGGSRIIQESYIKKLAGAMDELFLEKYGVHPSVVCDNYLCQQKLPAPGPKGLAIFTSDTQRIVQERRMYRCLSCSGLCMSRLSPEWLRPGNNGLLYSLALQQHGRLEENKIYNFSSYEVSCTYDAKKDMLILHKQSPLEKCAFCMETKLRLVYTDGSLAYENGDIVSSRSLSDHCQCGFKHWWAGKVYDNPPDMIPIVMKWRGREVTEVVPWFQYETDPNLNSNAYQVASYAVHKHFPGEFGIEQLIQKVVTQILDFSKCLDMAKKNTGANTVPVPPLKVYHDDEESPTKPRMTPSHLAQENNEPSVRTSSEGPVAVQLHGKRDQSKRMAAMSIKDSQSSKDSSTDKLHASPPNDSQEMKEEGAAMPIEKTDEEEGAMHIEKTKEEEAAMLQKVQTDLEEQQLQYKLRKDFDYQTQIKKRALQLALQAQNYEVSEKYDPSRNDVWGYGHYTVPFFQERDSSKDLGRAKGQMVFEPMEEDSFVPDPFGASTSKEDSFQFPVDMSKQSSTVRMGPGYSVLAPPQHVEPDMNTVQNLWSQKTDGLDTTKRLSAFPLVAAESPGSSSAERQDETACDKDDTKMDEGETEVEKKS
ncbi:deubiquitinating protein VCPIP1-like isoform X2 [Periplaneta americana]|uniref:deubiquitinating protein VCPIP1-like isoform X2 n=1 Tax=Periplaneta americana TaxID=6978 RepID=UPI0037E953E9